MKRFISIVTILILLLSLGLTAFAEDIVSGEEPSGNEDAVTDDLPTLDEGVTVIPGTQMISDVNRFLNIGDTVDISAGYMTFMLSNGKPGRVSLKNEMLTVVPDTSKVGLTRSSVSVYETETEILFLVLDENRTIASFEDVTASFWGFKAIRRTVKAGMFEGRSQTEFAIKANMTRAEFCQVLYNIYKEDKIMTPVRELTFSDLKEGAWYVNAVTVCANAGIVAGVGDGKFDPEGNITRQDAAVMMMNVIYGSEYTDSLDYEKTLEDARKKGIAALDIDDTSDYAKNSMAAALGVIYQGDNAGNLNPKSRIIRAEVASLLSEYFFKDYIETEPHYLVYLSPSNQMSNQYANYYKNKNYTEGIQMQLVTEYVKQELEKMGYEVFVADVKTPINDTIPYGGEWKEDGITSRAEEAAAMNADAYVAIHSNAAGSSNNGSAQGTMVFYNGENKGAEELATAIHKRVGDLTPTKERSGSVQEDISYSKEHGQSPYAEVWRPSMANLILEVEFHDYEPYADWIVANIKELGSAIALGIDDYFSSL